MQMRTCASQSKWDCVGYVTPGLRRAIISPNISYVKSLCDSFLQSIDDPIHLLQSIIMYQADSHDGIFIRCRPPRCASLTFNDSAGNVFTILFDGQQGINTSGVEVTVFDTNLYHLSSAWIPIYRRIVNTHLASLFNGFDDVPTHRRLLPHSITQFFHHQETNSRRSPLCRGWPYNSHSLRRCFLRQQIPQQPL